MQNRNEKVKISEKFNIGITSKSIFWQITFLIAGVYTAVSVIPGIINPKDGIFSFTNQITEDWDTLYFFRSLWITVFVFGIGFLIAALEPRKHIGIVILGFIGKLLFATNLLIQYSNGKLSKMAITAAYIDLLFVLLFGIFIIRHYYKK